VDLEILMTGEQPNAICNLTGLKLNPLLKAVLILTWQGCLDGRKTTSNYVFTFAGGAVSWQPKLQKCVTLSTIEVEYVVVVESWKEMLWMKRFLQELGLKQKEYVVFCDS